MRDDNYNKADVNQENWNEEVDQLENIEESIEELDEQFFSQSILLNMDFFEEEIEPLEESEEHQGVGQLQQNQELLQLQKKAESIFQNVMKSRVSADGTNKETQDDMPMPDLNLSIEDDPDYSSIYYARKEGQDYTRDESKKEQHSNAKKDFEISIEKNFPLEVKKDTTLGEEKDLKFVRKNDSRFDLGKDLQLDINEEPKKNLTHEKTVFREDRIVGRDGQTNRYESESLPFREASNHSVSKQDRDPRWELEQTLETYESERKNPKIQEKEKSQRDNTDALMWDLGMRTPKINKHANSIRHKEKVQDDMNWNHTTGCQRRKKNLDDFGHKRDGFDFKNEKINLMGDFDIKEEKKRSKWKL